MSATDPSAGPPPPPGRSRTRAPRAAAPEGPGETADRTAGAARRVAHRVVVRTLAEGAWADRALHGEARRLRGRERAQAKRLAFGCVQQRLALDHLVAQHVDRRLDPEVRAALHVGLFELLHGDGTPERAAVAAAVELAKPSPGAKLVNAVLRRLQREGVTLPGDETPGGAAIRHSHPPWLVKLWWSWLGPEETRALLAAGNAPSEVTVRANALRPGEVPGEPCDPDLPDARRIDGALDALVDPRWRAGHYAVMSRASMRAARAVAARPGERVLDLCAAPGGKTGHIAAQMAGEGTILALEVREARAAALEREMERLGATNVDVRHADALRADLPAGSFDRVLVDAPCSGLGTLAAHPDLRWRVKPDQIPGLVALQDRLLEVAERALAPGGRLVYAVCTLNPEEERLRTDDHERLLPHRDGTDGFYHASRGG